ncbi:thioredoxin fold domain-containing protein [Butyricimonas sp.]|uniref:thioredoxin family protein n=1 Tax=Butyricimonas sp. TaxID=1969738 RepID=UPI0025B9884A|nr:thioredoxin fold domain-containing protein [Butyricimonas sp.]
MKLIIIIALVLCMPGLTRAQEQGIRFDKSMSWWEVVEKATRENKYIYVDVMATWCGPCQAMVKNIFPQREVGDFYNEHFICLKLQTDKTAKDDEYVKAWHKEVNDICTKAKIKVLPTSLYYNPQGELVHIIPGGMPDAGRFVEAGKIALDENRQIFTCLKKYEAGERDVEFLYELSVNFLMLGDKVMARKVGNTFWQTITPEERLLDKGIRYAADFFESVDDAMLPLFMDHPERVDAVLGKGVADQKVIRAIEAKYINSLMKDSVNIPDWDGLYRELTERYPKKQESIRKMLLNRKLGYGQRYHNDGLCAAALKELLPICWEEGSEVLIPNYAYELGRKAQDKEAGKIALEWLERTLDETNAYQLLNYADILFLNKQKGKGLKCVNTALKLTEEGSKLHERAMEMKKKNAREMKFLKQVMNEIN